MIVDARNSNLDAVGMDHNDDHMVSSTMEIEQSPCPAETQKETSVSGDCKEEKVLFASANIIQDNKKFLPDDGLAHKQSQEIWNNFASAGNIVEAHTNSDGIGGKMQVLDGNNKEVEFGEKVYGPLLAAADQNGFPPQNVSAPPGTLVSRFVHPQQFYNFPQTDSTRLVEEEAQRRYLEFLRSRYPPRDPWRPPNNLQACQRSRNVRQTYSTSLKNKVERQKHPINNFQEFQHSRNTPQTNFSRNFPQTSAFSPVEKGAGRQNLDVCSSGNQNEGISSPFDNCQEFQYSTSSPQTNLNRHPHASPVSFIQNCVKDSVGNHFVGTTRQPSNCQPFQHSGNIPQTNMTGNPQRSSSVGATGQEFGWQNCSSAGNHFEGISRHSDNRQEFLTNLIKTPQTNFVQNFPQTNPVCLAEKEVGKQNCESGFYEGLSTQPNNFQRPMSTPQTSFIPPQPSPIALTEMESGSQNCEVSSVGNQYEGFSTPPNNYQEFQHFSSVPQRYSVVNLPQPNPINLMNQGMQSYKPCGRNQHEVFPQQLQNMQDFQQFRSSPHPNSVGNPQQPNQHPSSVRNLPQPNQNPNLVRNLPQPNQHPNSVRNLPQPNQHPNSVQNFQQPNQHPNSASNLPQPNLSDWVVKEMYRMSHEMRSLKQQYEGFLKQHDYLQEFQRFRSPHETRGNSPQTDPTSMMAKEIERLKYEMRSLSNEYEVCLRRHDKLQEFWRLRSVVETNSIRNHVQSNPVHPTEKGARRQNCDIRSLGNRTILRQCVNMQESQLFSIPQTSQINPSATQLKGQTEFCSSGPSSEGFLKRKNSSVAKAASMRNIKKKNLSGSSVAGTRKKRPPNPMQGNSFSPNAPFVPESQKEIPSSVAGIMQGPPPYPRQEDGSVAKASFVQETKREVFSFVETKSEFLGTESVSVTKTSFVLKSDVDYLGESSLAGTRSESSARQENSYQTELSFVPGSKKENLSASSLAETNSESSLKQENTLFETPFVKKNEILSESNVNAKSISSEESLSCPDCPNILQGTSALSCHSRIHNNLELYSCPACSIRLNSQEQLMYHLRCDHLKISGVQWYQCEVCEARFRCLLAFVTHLRGMHADEYYFRAMCQRCLCTLESDRQLKSLLGLVCDNGQSIPSSKSIFKDELDGPHVTPPPSPDCVFDSPEVKLIDLTEAEKEDSDVIQILDFFLEGSEDGDDKGCVKDSLSQAVEEVKSVKSEESEEPRDVKNSHLGIGQAVSSTDSQQFDLIDLTEDEIKDLETCQSVDSFSEDSDQEDDNASVADSLAKRIEETGSSKNGNREKFCLAENSVNGSTTAVYPTTNALVCSYCPAEFSNQNSLSKHIFDHFERKSYKCPCCRKHYKHEQSFYRHLKCHKRDLPYQCKFCLQRLNICCDLMTHLKTAHSDEYWLPGSFSLIKPKPNDPGGPVRNVVFPSADIQIESVYHLPGAFGSESPTDERACLCDFCGARFSTNSDLLSHVKTRHPGECQNSAAYGSKERSPALVPESVSHRGNHSCPHCPVQLSSKVAICKHIRRMHAEVRCPPTDRKNNLESDRVSAENHATGTSPRRQESTTHLTVRMYFCWFCCARFCMQISYMKHLKLCHMNAVIQRCQSSGDPDSSEFQESCVKKVFSMHGPQIQVECSYRFDGQTFACLFCPVRYVHRVHLVKHFMRVHPNKLCPVVGGSKSSEGAPKPAQSIQATVNHFNSSGTT